jgi:hypothetical protein
MVPVAAVRVGHFLLGTGVSRFPAARLGDLHQRFSVRVLTPNPYPDFLPRSTGHSRVCGFLIRKGA